MKKWFSVFFSMPWYPFAFGIYPALALLASNIFQVDLGVAIRPLIISLIASMLLLCLFWLFTHDWHRAAFPTTIFVLLFFTYGHVYDFIKNVRVFEVAIGRHRLLLFVWAVLGISAVFIATRKRIDFSDQSMPVNIIALILLVFPIYTIFTVEISVRQALSENEEPVRLLNIGGDQSLPDVYFIILDSYTRSDVFKNFYGYDNSFFTNDLKDMGFYVAECSSSNYGWTRLSLASTLNMQYLQDIPAYTSADDKEVITEELLKHSLVRRTFEGLGYQTVAFATGFSFNEITDSDLYLEPPILMRSIREFDALLIQTTLLRVFQDFGYIQINQTASAHFRDRTLFALEQFDDLGRMGGPKFVYIHIITPHPPFVFGPNGEAINPKEFLSTEGHYTDETYFNGYLGQVQFISEQVIVAIRKLLAESAQPPIIIIEGDHGPWKQDGQNRVSNLNAYYLPGHENGVYPNISPVNSFRVVFNEYLNEDYPLLDDVSYVSPYADVYDFSVQQTSCGNTK